MNRNNAYSSHDDYRQRGGRHYSGDNYHSNSWGRGRERNDRYGYGRFDNRGDDRVDRFDERHHGREPDDDHYGRGRNQNNGYNTSRSEQRWHNGGDGNGAHTYCIDRSGADDSGGGIKRPAQAHASGTIQKNATDPSKRVRSDEAPWKPKETQAASLPPETALTAAANEKPAAVTSELDVTDDEFEIPEDEDLYKQAFIDCLRDVDKDTTYVAKQAHVVPKGWNARKRVAAQQALHELSSLPRAPAVNNEYGSESSCSDDYDDLPGASRRSTTPSKGLTNAERSFVLALQYCPPLDAGFHVVDCWPKASKICFCPCGPSLGPWRQRHNILIEDEKCFKRDPYSNKKKKTGKSQFTPWSLMAHLKREGGMFEEKENRRMVKRPLWDIYHYATRVYLSCLYSDWHRRKNGSGFGHKGLHPPGTDEHEAALAEESRLLQKQINLANQEIRRQELENHRLKGELEEKEKERQKFMELSRDHQKRIEHLESLREKLKVEKKEHEEISEEKIAKYEEKLTDHFEMVKNLIGVSKDVDITVMGEAEGDSGFSLQSFFDTLYDKKSGDARAVLFGDENRANKITKLILSEWNIIYDKQESYAVPGGRKNDSKAKSRKKEDTGVDEGGPSRQFLTDVFKQFDTLCVKGSSKTNIDLFTPSPSGPTVTTDDFLKSKIKLAAKEAAKERSKEDGCPEDYEGIVAVLMERSKSYIRAIGRIILHAVAHNQTLPSNALHPFVMNVMFHGYDKDYHRDDILKHISMLTGGGRLDLDKEGIKWLDEDGVVIGTECADEDGNAWTPDTFFGTYVPDNFIRNGKILLGSLRDGLSLGGRPDPPPKLEKGCGLSAVFSSIPVQAIQRIYFAKQNISLEGLLNVLRPKYGEGDPDPKFGFTEEDKERLKREQRKFYEENFSRYIKESYEEDKSFLVKFVECATGSNYLPHDKKDKKMEIIIEFNFSEIPDSLPKFHACTSEVVLPGYDAFFGTYEVFKTKKMNFAIDEVYNKFHMN